MKTAMQELIDEFRHLCYDKDFHLGLSGIKVTQEIIDGLEKKYLDKEKEQKKKIAVDFFHWNNKGILTNGNSKTEDAFEDFYNQTFNKQ